MGWVSSQSPSFGGHCWGHGNAKILIFKVSPAVFQSKFLTLKNNPWVLELFLMLNLRQVALNLPKFNRGIVL